MAVFRLHEALGGELLQGRQQSLAGETGARGEIGKGEAGVEAQRIHHEFEWQIRARYIAPLRAFRCTGEVAPRFAQVRAALDDETRVRITSAREFAVRTRSHSQIVAMVPVIEIVRALATCK